MAGPSTSSALTQVEQTEFLEEILDDKVVSDFSSESDSECDIDYTQLVTPGTHVVSDSDLSDNDETQEETVQVESGSVSSEFV